MLFFFFFFVLIFFFCFFVFLLLVSVFVFVFVFLENNFGFLKCPFIHNFLNKNIMCYFLFYLIEI